MQPVSQGGQKRADGIEGVFVGSLVHPIDARKFPPAQVTRHGLVGRDHEFFDHPVGDGPFRAPDVRGHVVVVEQDFRVRQLEVEAPAGAPPVHEEVGQLLHRPKGLDELRVFRDDRRVPVHKDLSDLGVGESGRAVDRRREELRPLHFPFAVDLQQRRPGQPVGLRLEAADAGGQHRRQHGQGPVREIHAGAAGMGLAVQNGAPGHVMGHVGNGDVQPVTLGRGPLDAHGIVEVAGRLAVYGEGRQRRAGPGARGGSRDRRLQPWRSASCRASSEKSSGQP